ncbi:class I glutamine amidotransferase-like protein [Zopfia rhizophila CBS 207.26]|uniref:Class I glutamine amidotransferase-like protein n=1 Tax=Zopfia rhizophila CBS 207.26 TaxID=1314779 RepID=A0A6A6DYH5_9PEZI|nr:class I glutamine amidotransferase-like protein [Zopfia rhizophila CBS 207.26]
MSSPPKNFGVVLFPGFQSLDVFGPLDVLNILSTETNLNLSILAATLDPVSTKHKQGKISNSNFHESIVPTHTFDSAPKDLEVLLIPGGFGTRDEANLRPAIEFIKTVYPSLKYCLTVCTGSAVLAKTGVLDGRQATSNKKAFVWAKEQGPNVKWVSKARWVVDGNIWTSSGISAGIDLIYAWVEQVYGEEIAGFIADSSEYERNRDSGRDRFAERWGVAEL